MHLTPNCEAKRRLMQLDYEPVQMPVLRIFLTLDYDYSIIQHASGMYVTNMSIILNGLEVR